MLIGIAERFSNEILHRAAQLYGTNSERLVDYEGYENFVYGFERAGQEYVLRVGHTFHRSQLHVLAELDWLNYLSDQRLPIAIPVPSLNGAQLEVINPEGENDYFIATAFKRAPGVDLGGDSSAKKKWWKGDLFEQWGALMGELHHQTKQYRVANGKPHRPDWDEWAFLDLGRWIPADQKAVIAYGTDLKRRLRAHPQSSETYGLIHGDFTQVNFTVHQGKITVFDFSRSEYAWFIKDIAIALYCAVRGSQPTPSNFIPGFLNRFLSGYRRENHLDVYWLKLLPEFLSLDCRLHRASHP